jgi:hypothetical protein
MKLQLALVLAVTSVLAADLPAPPPDGVRDDAHLFSDLARQKLVHDLQACQQATGIRGFIDSNTYIDGGQRASDRARQLLRTWSPGEPAFVFCMDRSAPKPGAVDVSAELWTRYTEPDLIRVLSTATAALGENTTDEVHVQDAVAILVEGLQGLEAQTQVRSRLIGGHDWALLTGFLVLLTLGGAATLWLVRRNREADAADDVQHYFPTVEVGQRLGAPNGGGEMAAIQFGQR